MTTTDVYQGMSDEAKPSSRVLAPPGGGGSDIFGTGLGTAPPPPPASGKGCQGNTRNQSSMILGDDSPPEAVNRAQRRDDRSGKNIFGPPDPQRAPPPRPEDKVFGTPTRQYKSNQASVEEEEDDYQENQSKRKQRVGVNPITGEAYGPPKGKDVHTSINVKQPPGGASSGPLW